MREHIPLPLRMKRMSPLGVECLKRRHLVLHSQKWREEEGAGLVRNA